MRISWSVKCKCLDGKLFYPISFPQRAALPPVLCYYVYSDCVYRAHYHHEAIVQIVGNKNHIHALYHFVYWYAICFISMMSREFNLSRLLLLTGQSIVLCVPPCSRGKRGSLLLFFLFPQLICRQRLRRTLQVLLNRGFAFALNYA